MLGWLCTMQSQPSIHSLSRGKGGRGIGIINQKLISKTDFFYNLQNFFTEIFIFIFSLPDSMRIRFYG